MTREEKLDWLYRLRSQIYVYMPKVWQIPMIDALDMAIKALEQEPCEDAISREKAKQFLYERLDRLNDNELYDIFSRIIDDMYNELPPVNPQPKTGYWIYQKGYVPYKWKCNLCSADFKTDFHFCPNCGAKMVEPQESEDKE